MRKSRVNDPEGSVETGLHDPVEGLGCHIENGFHLMMSASVRHNDIERTELRDGLSDKLDAE